MSKRVRIKLNRAAVRALMKSPKCGRYWPSRPRRLPGGAATATETRVGTAETRAIATVYPADAAARRDNHKNNTLERALR